jgi:hypothetical protein
VITKHPKDQVFSIEVPEFEPSNALPRALLMRFAFLENSKLRCYEKNQCKIENVKCLRYAREFMLHVRRASAPLKHRSKKPLLCVTSQKIANSIDGRRRPGQGCLLLLPTLPAELAYTELVCSAVAESTRYTRPPQDE